MSSYLDKVYTRKPSCHILVLTLCLCSSYIFLPLRSTLIAITTIPKTPLHTRNFLEKKGKNRRSKTQRNVTYQSPVSLPPLHTPILKSAVFFELGEPPPKSVFEIHFPSYNNFFATTFANSDRYQHSFHLARHIVPSRTARTILCLRNRNRV
jgi:hypothetical protein